MANPVIYTKHVFFCTNNRPEGRKSCGGSGAHDIFVHARQIVAAARPDQGIRINTSGCLGQCKNGPVLVVYPDTIWFSYSSVEEAERILQEHVLMKD